MDFERAGADGGLLGSIIRGLVAEAAAGPTWPDWGDPGAAAGFSPGRQPPHPDCLLRLAVHSGLAGSVADLLEIGANPDAPGIGGASARDWARSLAQVGGPLGEGGMAILAAMDGRDLGLGSAPGSARGDRGRGRL